MRQIVVLKQFSRHNGNIWNWLSFNHCLEITLSAWTSPVFHCYPLCTSCQPLYTAPVHHVHPLPATNRIAVGKSSCPLFLLPGTWCLALDIVYLKNICTLKPVPSSECRMYMNKQSCSDSGTVHVFFFKPISFHNCFYFSWIAK